MLKPVYKFTVLSSLFFQKNNPVKNFTANIIVLPPNELINQSTNQLITTFFYPSSCQVPIASRTLYFSNGLEYIPVRSGAASNNLVCIHRLRFSKSNHLQSKHNLPLAAPALHIQAYRVLHAPQLTHPDKGCRK